MSTIEISRSHLWIAVVAVVIVIIGIGYGVWRYIALQETLDTTVQTYEDKVAMLDAELADASDINIALQEAYNEERNRNEDFQDQIGDLSETVDTLDKLSKTDPQLLAKYSKVYFLNENYAPAALSKIPKQFVSGDKELEFHRQAMPHLRDLFEEAEDDGIDLLALSAYRSFTTQAALKSNYRVVYGAGANAFSADQGYSEHQLGTALDFTTASLNGTLDGFEKTPAYEWLQKNAYKYGFVLSYPANNAYYVFEPWHWRYVGEDLARDLHNDKKNFYDLDQRDINAYLISLF